MNGQMNTGVFLRPQITPKLCKGEAKLVPSCASQPSADMTHTWSNLTEEQTSGSQNPATHTALNLILKLRKCTQLCSFHLCVHVLPFLTLLSSGRSWPWPNGQGRGQGKEHEERRGLAQAALTPSSGKADFAICQRRYHGARCVAGPGGAGRILGVLLCVPHSLLFPLGAERYGQGCCGLGRRTPNLESKDLDSSLATPHLPCSLGQVI